MNMAFVCRIFGINTDERFMEHRRRSTSLAGIITALVQSASSNTATSTTTSGVGTCFP